MRRSVPSVFDVSLMVVLASVAAFTAVTLARPQGRPTIAPAPNHWVAFSAKVEILSPGATVYGTFTQGPDGSTRKETGPAPGNVVVVDIKNIARGRTYRYHSANGWVEHPMRLPSEYVPRVFAPHLLQNAQPVKYEALDAFTLTSPDARVDIIVPALDNFVVDRILPNGRRERFSDITILKDLSSMTFEPPAGVQAQYRDTPAGIIQHDPDDLEVDSSGKVTWKNRR